MSHKNNRYFNYKEKEKKGEYINPDRPAWVDAMVKEADKFSRDMDLQRSMLDGKVPHLTRKERKRFAGRIKRMEKSLSKKSKESGVGKVAREIQRLTEIY